MKSFNENPGWRGLLRRAEDSLEVRTRGASPASRPGVAGRRRVFLVALARPSHLFLDKVVQTGGGYTICVYQAPQVNRERRN